MTLKKFGKFILVFIISFSWIFSGWPQVFNFPEKVKEAKAATLSYVGTAEASGNSASYNVTLPAMQQGDLVIVSTGFVGTANGDPGVSTSGYTEVADLWGNDTRDANFSVNWKVMGATPDTTVTCLGSGVATNGAVCVVHVWRGADPVTPMDVTDVEATLTNSTAQVNSGSITPVTLGAIVISTGLQTSTAVDTTITAPTGYGNQADISVDPGNAATVGISSKSWSGSGAEDPAAWTNWANTTSDSWAAVTLAIRPAPAYAQSAYRFFNNSDSTNVGTTLALQDTPATLNLTGDAFRLRMLMHQTDGRMNVSGENFKLQFAEKSGTCDTAFSGETYTDVTGATAIAYNNNATPADGDNLTSNANDPTHGGDTIVNQDYEEANNFTNSVAAIPAGQDGKWDFALVDNGAPADTSYCFRVVKSDNSNLDTYSVIPEVMTASVGAAPSLTFSISDNSIGFGTLAAGDDFFANGAGTGSATEVEAHTISASTNATSGYSITINGSTLSYGGNTINAIGASNTASSAGTEQFGLRMTASGGDGAVSAPYAAAGFAFDTAAFPDLVASDTNGDDITTTYSVRYVGNITSTTEAGPYNAILTYVITASF